MDKWSFGEPPEYRNHLKGYDLFFDFDSPNPEDLAEAHKDVLKMKASLDRFQVPAIYTMSGTKGFHVRMPFKILPQTLGWDLVTFCKLIGEMCSKKMELKTLDISVFDDRRVFKAPYSYDRGNICLPLDDNQIENFDIKQMGVVNVLNKLKIFNRGELMRHTNFSIEQQREHFREWFKELRK
jgi:DNA primase